MAKQPLSPPLRYADSYPEVVTRLQVLPRTGWVQWQIENPETVWEHILATRELAVTLRDTLQLREEEFADLLAMIEIHDWPEALVGDDVILGDEPDVATLRQQKQKRELAAMQEICSDKAAGAEIFRLYKRYAHGSDRVAQLVKQLEKLQAVLKAIEYGKTHSKAGLAAEFIHYTRELIHEPALKARFEQLAA